MVVAAVSATESAICQIGGPGGSMMRSSIRNGVAVGKSDRPMAIGLSGALMIANHVIHGSIMINIAGVIMPCASFRSVHAAPMVMKIDPKMKAAITRNRYSHMMSDMWTTSP